MDSLRKKVSKKKIRYEENGYNLDLTYITDRMIAMGFPSCGSERLFRNPVEEVVRFFEELHPDKYKVYNLCSEKNRTYDVKTFRGRVAQYPFPDHNPPPLSIMLPFVRDVTEWLDADPDNIAAVHCKAGKGRTGTMISAWLYYTKQAASTEEALDFFGKKRTSDGKGVTIPSQKRYVKYFEDVVASEGRICENPPQLEIQKIILHTTPRFDVDKGCDPYVEIRHGPDDVIFNSKKETQHYINEEVIEINCQNTAVSGDVKILAWDYDMMTADDPMFHFWFHTAFIHDNRFVLTKAEIDQACKDKNHKLFDQDFYVEVIFNNNEKD